MEQSRIFDTKSPSRAVAYMPAGSRGISLAPPGSKNRLGAVNDAVQRIIVPGTELETGNDDHYDAIFDELYNENFSLARLNEFNTALKQKAEPTESEREFLKILEAAITKRTDIENVYNLAGQSGGVWTVASVFINDALAHQTVPERARHGIAGIYKDDAPGVGGEEITESERDSEIGTLEQLNNFLVEQDLTQITNLDIVLSGNMGPCDGCKGRIAAFVRDLKALARHVRASFELTLDISYTTASARVPRNMVPTRYGYEDEMTITVMGGTDDEYEYYSKTSVEQIE